MTDPLECPPVDVLEQLLLGQVVQAIAEALETHVLQCPRCTQALQHLRAEDGLVQAMREARAESDIVRIAASCEAVDAMIPWLKRLRPKDATQTMSLHDPGGATIDTATTLPSFDFLARPELPGELGRLGKYRVLQSIGMGGMGMVFLAEDQKLQRQVAVKVIKPELLQRPELHERFLSEARAIAQVEHDNIVAIFEADDIAGVPYLVMPLLNGQSLEDRLRQVDGPLPIDEILKIGREIAAGLAAAHERGMIHRDIKPSNIWLESRGVVSNDKKPTANLSPLTTHHSPLATHSSTGRVKILDFGLARTVQGLNEDGKSSAILGTPAYMSPEQGRGLPVDARTDLFSLGCVIYRMATGRMPFYGKDIVTTILSVATESPVPPRQFNPKLPADLVQLIEKLLAKKPDQRFTGAKEVVDAIQKIERQRQPRAIGRWLAFTAACVAVAIAGTFGVFAALHRPLPPLEPCEITFAYDEPDATLIVQRGEEPEEEIDVKQTPTRMLLPGDYTIRPKKQDEQRTLWPAAFTVNPNEPKVFSLRWVGLIRSYHGPGQTLWSVAFSPRKDAPLALAACNNFDIYVWDTTQADENGRRLEGQQSPVRCVVFSPEGKQALSGGGKPGRRPDNSVRVWDVAGRKCLATLLGHESTVRAVAWDPKGKTLLSGDMGGVVIWWDAQTHQPLESLQVHKKESVTGLAYLPDGKQALSCGADHKLKLLDVEKRSILLTMPGHTDTVTGVSVAQGGKHAATSSADGTVRIWKLPTGECPLILRGHDKSAHCVAYSPDGKRLLSGDGAGALRLWDAATGALIHTFLGHKGAVFGVAYSPDGRRAVSGGVDRITRLWELPK